MPQGTVGHLKNGNAGSRRLVLQTMPFIKYHHLIPRSRLSRQDRWPNLRFLLVRLTSA